MPKKAKNNEAFTRSVCECDFCKSTHDAVEKWDSYRPQTNLQSRMKECVSKIEVLLIKEPSLRKLKA